MTTRSSCSDQILEAEVARLRNAIEQWAEARELWHDCGFADYLSHVGGEPNDPPVVSLLVSDGPLGDVLAGEDVCEHEPEFRELLEANGYWYECINHYTFAIFADDGPLVARFKDYFHWRWVCGLIEEDTADVYEEIYSHFRVRPDDLNRLDWRKFEVLLFRIFQNHGFRAVLGPGRGDEGIDLRLFQTDPIGDVMTVVQAKRYSMHNKIDQTQVAALYGVSVVENADKALFVTSSRYSPVARRFAARTSGRLELAERNDVVDWCERAEHGVLQDKSSLISHSRISSLLNDVAQKRDARVVHGTWGYGMTHNEFALVVRESRHAALLVGLPNLKVSDDGYGQVGVEIPNLIAPLASELLTPQNVWRAKRKSEGGRVTYWTGGVLYSPWDGRGKYFNYMD